MYSSDPREVPKTLALLAIRADFLVSKKKKHVQRWCGGLEESVAKWLACMAPGHKIGPRFDSQGVNFPTQKQ